jgi:carbon monoxide dehydrogenase subunit G
MPAGTASCAIPLDVPGVWEFVRDYTNWASLFPGYQQHAVRSPCVSRWTVRGDVGMFSRVVDLEVRVAEETAERRVRFTIEGLTENVSGEGLFELAAVEAGGSKLSLTIDITARGAVGPVINALLGPRLRTLLDTFAAALARRLTPTEPAPTSP